MEKIKMTKLKELRIERGYTQQFMANFLGYRGVSGYSELERNGENIDLVKAKKISELFNIPINDIFLFSNSK